MNKITKIFLLVVLFCSWSIWNEKIYDSNISNAAEQIVYYFQGFQGFDKKCMGWLLIHMPIQMYLTLRMSRNLHVFSIYYYMKKGTMTKLWLEEFWISAKLAILYYMGGSFCTLMWLYLIQHKRELTGESILLLLMACIILSLSAVTFTFLVLFIEGVVTNFQAAFTIAIIIQIIFIILNQKINNRILSFPLSHTDIYTQSLKQEPCYTLLIQCIIEVVLIVIGGLGITKKRFEKIIGEI